jgi:hypothetical protein
MAAISSALTLSMVQVFIQHESDTTLAAAEGSSRKR